MIDIFTTTHQIFLHICNLCKLGLLSSLLFMVLNEDRKYFMQDKNKRRFGNLHLKVKSHYMHKIPSKRFLSRKLTDLFFKKHNKTKNPAGSKGR